MYSRSMKNSRGETLRLDFITCLDLCRKLLSVSFVFPIDDFVSFEFDLIHMRSALRIESHRRCFSNDVAPQGRSGIISYLAHTVANNSIPRADKYRMDNGCIRKMMRDKNSLQL